LASVEGVNRTAKALSLDYYSLKERLDRQVGSSASKAGTAPEGPFVEVTPSMLAYPQECVIELESASGSKMRISVKGGDAVDLVAVGRALWIGP